MEGCEALLRRRTARSTGRAGRSLTGRRSGPLGELFGHEFLLRHHTGDWGDLDPEDVEANRAALHYGSRLLSSYDIGHQKLWIITEADRSTTTVLLPEEY